MHNSKKYFPKGGPILRFKLFLMVVLYVVYINLYCSLPQRFVVFTPPILAAFLSLWKLRNIHLLMHFLFMLGSVKFSMVYDFQEQNLSITIFEANDLPSADEDGASDPYIRVMLLPDTKRRFETVVSSCLSRFYSFYFSGQKH